jgi:hypothetical protein
VRPGAGAPTFRGGDHVEDEVEPNVVDGFIVVGVIVEGNNGGIMQPKSSATAHTHMTIMNCRAKPVSGIRKASLRACTNVESAPTKLEVVAVIMHKVNKNAQPANN